MTIRAIAWDIDGTLVDSEPLHHRALLAASQRFDADLSDLSEDRFRGVQINDVWTLLAGRLPESLEREAWLDAIDEHYAQGVAELVAIEGAIEAMRDFAGRGLRQICVSNSNRRIVDANIGALGIADLIAFSISFDDVTHGKPDPEPYRLACARLRLASADVLAIEDSATGAISAKAAGLVVAAYAPSTGFLGEADVTVARFQDLVDWVGVRT